MKTLFITILLTSRVVLSSQAQGIVFFGSTFQYISTNNTDPYLGAIADGRIQGPSNCYFALFYTTSVPLSTASISGFGGFGSDYASYAFESGSGYTLVTSTLGTNTSIAGRFLGASNPDGTTTVNGLAGGSSAYFVIVGWSANLGASVLALENSLMIGQPDGLLGQSGASGLITVGSPPGGPYPAPGVMGPSAPLIQAFTLGSVNVFIPEPGTTALAALGGFAWFLCRRKK